MHPLPSLSGFAFLTVVSAVLVGAPGSAAAAGGRSGHGGFHGGFHHGGHAHGHFRHGGFRHGGLRRIYTAPGYAGPYGFADPVLEGDYVGAPLTRFPRPNEIVPPAWGYGTYGIPTMTGIRQAPSAQPTLYVIESPAPASAPLAVRQDNARSGILRRGPGGDWSSTEPSVGTTAGGARVITVTVPRR